MRYRCRRNVSYPFVNREYRPRRFKNRVLESIQITDEELETLRLRYIEDINQREAAEMMGISQSQYQRDISGVIRKITEALISGHQINLVVKSGLTEDLSPGSEFSESPDE